MQLPMLLAVPYGASAVSRTALGRGHGQTCETVGKWLEQHDPKAARRSDSILDMVSHTEKG